MIKPMKKDCVTLSDLKRCKMTPIFFDTFFNLEKYMEHEQRDPFAQKENEEVIVCARNNSNENIFNKHFLFLVVGLGSLCCSGI